MVFAAPRFRLNVDTEITLQRSELALLLRCGNLHPDQHARWVTAPKGFIYQAYRQVAAKPDSAEATINATRHEIRTILSLLEHQPRECDPVKSIRLRNEIQDLRRKYRALLAKMEEHHRALDSHSHLIQQAVA